MRKKKRKKKHRERGGRRTENQLQLVLIVSPTLVT
jgi:hypothetical protein